MGWVGAQGVFPPRARVEPGSAPPHLCDKNKVTHSLSLQKPSTGTVTNALRNWSA